MNLENGPSRLFLSMPHAISKRKMIVNFMVPDFNSTFNIEDKKMTNSSICFHKENFTLSFPGKFSSYIVLHESIFSSCTIRKFFIDFVIASILLALKGKANLSVLIFFCFHP